MAIEITVKSRDGGIPKQEIYPLMAFLMAMGFKGQFPEKIEGHPFVVVNPPSSRTILIRNTTVFLEYVLPRGVLEQSKWIIEINEDSTGNHWHINGIPFFSRLEFGPSATMNLPLQVVNLMIIQNVNFPDFQQLPWFIGSMPHLESLALIYVGWLRDIWTLGDCHQLKHLTIAGDNLRSIRPLAGSANLRTLRLFFCSNLESLEGVETLQKLSHLEIDYCAHIRNLTPLKDLKSLRKLHIRGSDIQDLSPLAGLDQLESLALVNMPKLRKITTMGSKPLLSDLTIHNCKLVANLKPLLQMESLRACSLHGFKGKQICPVFSLKNMKSLDLSMCTMEDRDLFGVLKLLQLEAVALSGAINLQHLDNLTALVGLRRLELQCCVNLTSLTFLKYMNNLVELDLTCCWHAGSLDALAHCPALEKLSLSAYNFREMNPAILERLPQLRELKMAGWAGLKDLSCLKSLLHLEQLDIRHCTSLENIDHLAGLTQINNITCDPSHLELMTEGLQGLRKFANAESRISYSFIFDRTEPFPGSIPHMPAPRTNYKMYKEFDELVQKYAKLAGEHFSGRDGGGMKGIG